MALKSTGDAAVDDMVKVWMTLDRNETTRAELTELVEEKNVEELKKRLLKRIEFGTAGLRAKMGAGFSLMNDLTVIQSTQGILRYLQATCPSLKNQGVVIGYDGRHNSKIFSQLTAAVFLNDNVPVYLFSRMIPTPYVSFAVSHMGCECGIMITASHNPKEDNGYKVYWNNGAQIISPIDKGIAKSILEHLEPWPESWNIKVLDSSPLIKDPFEKIHRAYNDALSELRLYSVNSNSKSPVKLTYTAMHGVGYPFAVEALKTFGFPPPIPVKEQIEPDPDFPTVKYPNPEEGKGALKLSIKTANEHDSPIILANDPDADRLALAEKLPSGNWKVFTGNEIGGLLGWWMWHCYQTKNPNASGADVYMLASTVSSKILQSIGKKEGFKFEETLTGFKWMGNRADSLKKAGKTVLFAFEEAIGFMCGTKVFDKDGVSAAAVLAEMAAYLYKENKSFDKKLEEIFCRYGYHISNNSYYICHDPDTIEKMFAEIRNYNGSGTYPTSCGSYKITGIRDLTVGFDSNQPDKKPLFPVSKSSQMITFMFACGCVATLRTSGTEPKIKYYTELCTDPQRGLDQKAAVEELQDIVHCIQEHFFQPQKFGLIGKQQ